MKFRQKPVEIEALQWTGENSDDVRKFCPSFTVVADRWTARIQSKWGWTTVKRDQWVLKNTDGTFDAVEDAFLKQNYD